jgi:Domain of unknown function DUF29
MNKHTHPQRLTAYDIDYFLWSEHQAALLRQGKLTLLDIENLAGEIESLGRSDRRALMSQVQRRLVHLLKWQFQPGRRSVSWESRSGPPAERSAAFSKTVQALKTPCPPGLKRNLIWRAGTPRVKPAWLNQYFPHNAPIQANIFWTNVFCRNRKPFPLSIPRCI